MKTSPQFEVTYEVTGVDRDKTKDRRTVLHIGVNNQTFAKPVQELISGFRWNNPFRDYKKFVVPKALEMLGIDPKTVKVRWSQKAGCPCGCSPGFIIRGPQWNEWSSETFWAHINMNIKGQLELGLTSENS